MGKSFHWSPSHNGFCDKLHVREELLRPRGGSSGADDALFRIFDSAVEKLTPGQYTVPRSVSAKINMRRHVVLAVDESSDDLALLQNEFQRSAPGIDFRTFTDRYEVVAYLEGVGQYMDRNAYPFPRLLILGVKKNEISRFDVLQRIDRMVERPFVAVMAERGLEGERDKAMELGAVAFRIKPVDREELSEFVTRLVEFFCAGSARL